MEPLPTGANFRRAKFLWELGLHIAGNPAIKYGGNRDMCIAVGSGGGDKFIPSLRMASGSAIMAHDVIKGGIDMAFVNPSAMLTQAYRGVGLFDKPLPVRIVGSYPSWDRFVITFRKELGFRSLHDVKKARYPLQMSLREDPTHSTLVLIHQLLPFYGMSLAEIESWGGRIHPCGGPGDKRRLNAIKDGTIDAIFDEGIVTWLDKALAGGMVPIELEPEAFASVGKLGWRRVSIPKSEYPELLDRDHPCIDFSGWPVYASAALPDQVVYDVCAAWAARAFEMPWEEGTYTGITQVFTETDATPMDVPLHPGAERWLREQGK
jgi:TRAP-type uncharacterized transport system substrate-binding protein